MSVVLVGLLPLAVTIVVLKRRGWRPDRWSAAERRRRAWIAVALGLAFAVGAGYTVAIGAWLLGPDCGVEPSAGVRFRIVVLGIVVAVTSSMMPVAIAGRRRVALLAAAAPATVPLFVAVASAASNQPGWCLF